MRLVIKAGSNVLTRSDGKLDITRISALTDQIAWLRQQGHEVILVSSGAVACGRGELRHTKRMDSVEQRQLFSALGQARLINLYYDLFREYGIHVGQVLTMKENFASRREYLNQRSCMSVMLDNGVIPIVNENDTVSVTELMFTDNDELSGLIASMMNADMLIILSNVDGIYTGEPGSDRASVIATVGPGDDVTQYIRTARSSAGRGGMTTKCGIARKIADEGISVIIANGKREDILKKTDHATRTRSAHDIHTRPGGRVGSEKMARPQRQLRKGSHTHQRQGTRRSHRRRGRKPAHGWGDRRGR